MVKKFLLGASVFSMMSISASAADMIEPIADTSWTGAYVGLVGGYGWGEAEYAGTQQLAGLAVGSLDLEGALLGAQIGGDFDLGNGFVIGVAADASWTDIDDTDNDVNGTSDVIGDVEWLSTVRARAGFAMGDALIYGTGGIAFAEVRGEVTDVNPPADSGDDRSDRQNFVGYVIGAGLEFKVTDNVSIGAEYLHVDLGEESFEFDSLVGPVLDAGADADIDLDIVRASLNFRL